VIEHLLLVQTFILRTIPTIKANLNATYPRYTVSHAANLAIQKRECPQSQEYLNQSKQKPEAHALTVKLDSDDKTNGKYLRSGTVDGTPVLIHRDTGASCIIVSSKVVPTPSSKAPRIVIKDYLGRSNSFPLTSIRIHSPYLSGLVDAAVAPLQFCDVLIGNVNGVLDENQITASERLTILK
jgi:hypothetical protein